MIDISVPIDPPANSDAKPQLKHKRSEVWYEELIRKAYNITGNNICCRDLVDIKPHEVVTCYAKYVPVHGVQVTGVLTITPTRVIFEPNLDDPGVAKDGVLAHQFSVDTGRLLAVGILR